VTELIGRLVTVETVETVYTGKLVEVGEEEVHLESELGWIVVSVHRIVSIRGKD